MTLQESIDSLFTPSDEQTARRLIQEFFWPAHVFDCFPWMYLIFYFMVGFSFIGAMLEMSFGATNVAPLLNFAASLAFFIFQIGIFGNFAYWFLTACLSMLIGISHPIKPFWLALVSRIKHLI